MEYYEWIHILKGLGFTQKSEEESKKNGSYFIMQLNGFEVEFSTGHLWENEKKDQTCIRDTKDLAERYFNKTKTKLDIN